MIADTKICYNCKFRGDTFKLGTLTHCHCEHPDERISGDKTTGWDTLREFYNTCDSFQKIQEEE